MMLSRIKLYVLKSHHHTRLKKIRAELHPTRSKTKGRLAVHRSKQNNVETQ